jgi:hypothetical protein
MKIKTQCICLPAIAMIFTAIAVSSCKKSEPVSIRSLLTEMTDRTSITRLPAPWYTLKQFSSYDRKSDTVNGKGWFANNDYTQFLSVDSSKGRKEYVLFDTDGPGAVVRWWMTFAGEGADKGTIRLYIDGNENPLIEDDVLKVISGGLLAGEPLSSSVSPETEPERRGHNLYLPLPYSKHCRITYECDAIKITATSRKPSIYYNICYRTYEKGTNVVSLTMDELKNADALIKETNSKLLSPSLNTATEKNLRPERYRERPPKPFNIPTGDSTIMKSTFKKGAAISAISLRLSAFDTEYALRSVVMKISFDGNQTVWVPVGDFFGTGFKKTESKTWNSSVDNELKMESYWLMPFKESCTIVIKNYGDQPVEAEMSLDFTDYKWTNKSMYFGASWHEYHQIATAGSELTGGTGRHRDINFADITGKGVYTGDAVTVFNTVEAWWGEGDEKIFVDNEKFPSSIGTGTEDYYGYAWCRPELFTHPFIAQPSGSGNFYPGLTINMRYRSLDAIPFENKISSNIELWHWLPAIINYGLTTYFYVLPDYQINIKGDIEAVKKPIPLDPEKPL